MKAVLISVNLDTHEVTTQFFARADYERDPVQSAWDLWRGIKEDWPGCQATVLADDEATEVHAAHRLGKTLEEYREWRKAIGPDD